MNKLKKFFLSIFGHFLRGSSGDIFDQFSGAFSKTDVSQ
jgi:hypothetical protein